MHDTFVIPAQAGIQPFTREARKLSLMPRGCAALDSGLRRSDGGGLRWLGANDLRRSDMMGTEMVHG